MSKLWQMSARAVAKSVSERAISAREHVRSALDRCEAINPKLNAIIGQDPLWSLAQAEAVDRRIAHGDSLPLAGVPITVKDNIWVNGQRITQGSRLFSDFIAPCDAWAVDRLVSLGAVIVGITNCSEFACKGVSNNLLHGITRSPWDVRLTAGGSSGGAVSATAAGIGALALATDAGGSVRRPAAHTGLVGMKPTFGVIPYGPGFDEPTFGMSVMGQIGRDVADVAFMWQQLQGFSQKDWGSQISGSNNGTHLSLASLNTPPAKTLRIAWSVDLGCGYAMDDDVRETLLAVVKNLEKDGYQIEESEPAWPGAIHKLPLLMLQQAGLAALFGSALDDDPTILDPDIAAQIRQGRQYSGEDFARLLLLREQIYASFAEFFTRFDILLCPTTPTVSWPVEQLGPIEIGGHPAGPRGHALFTPLFNFAQAPACSVPAGLARGLPVGLQVIGARYNDIGVMAMAAHIERLVGPLPRPHLWDND